MHALHSICSNLNQSLKMFHSQQTLQYFYIILLFILFCSTIFTFYVVLFFCSLAFVGNPSQSKLILSESVRLFFKKYV